MRFSPAAVVLASLACVAGCSAGHSAPPIELQQVEMPDLSTVANSVKEQVRAKEDALKRTLADAGASREQKTSAFGDLGKLLLAAEFNDAAQACFANAAILASADARWPYYRGHAFKATGQPAKAEESFERSLALQPDNVPAMYWIAEMLLDQGRIDSAEAMFERALSRDPRSTAVLSGIGHVDLAMRDYAGAAARFEQILSIDPSASFAHYPLALAYRGLGETQRANEHLRQPRDVEPGPADPWMQEVIALLDSAMANQSRGIEALRRGEPSTAVVFFRRATTLDPQSAALHHRLGTALFLTGDLADAMREFEEALRLSPQLARAHYSLGVLFASTQRNADAVDQFAAALRSDPDYLEARLALADVLRSMGRARDAMPHYAQILRGHPRAADAELGYAMSLAILGRREEAREHFAEGARRHPDRPEFTDALRHLRGGSDAP